MTTATKPPKVAKQDQIIEAPPKWPVDSNEGKAIERVAGWFAVTPGPLPPLGGNLDTSAKNRADALFNACRAWDRSGINPGYFQRDEPKDHEVLGKAIVEGMRATIEKHDRRVVADTLGEWGVLAGKVEARAGQLTGDVQRLAGELFVAERRLTWLYGSLPPQLAAHWPLPFGPLGRKLHARRLELIGLLSDAYSSSPDYTGSNMVSGILSPPHPGTPAVAHALDGWAKVAEAIKNGAAFTPEFAVDWSAIVPTAVDGFDELTELAVYILRIN